MFKELFRFEIKNRFRQPMIYIFFLVNFLLIFSATVSDNITVGGSTGNVNINSPYVLMFYPAVMSIIALLMITAFMNTAALRDYSVKFDQILFATPLRKLDFLGGRFLGALVVSVLPLLGVFLAIWLAGFTPWVDADKVGSFYLGAYLSSLVAFIIPNTLFIGAIVFSLATLFRNTIISFVGAIILLVAYGISGSLLADIDNESLAKLLDPLALNTLTLETKYWTMDEKNTQWLTLFNSPALLWNRLLWIGVAIAVFVFTYFRFSFARRRRKKKHAQREVSPQLAPALMRLEALPAVAVQDNIKTQLTQLWHQSKIEFKGVIMSTAFVVIMIVGLLNMGVGIQFVDQIYGTGNHPVTYLMVDAIRGTLFLFLIAILMYYSGVLVWKERDAGMNEFFDASPYPSWVPLLAKFLALLGATAIILLSGVAVGAITQAAKGYTNFEWAVYLREFFVYDLLQFTMFIIAALIIQVLVNNKYLGYFVFLVFIIANIYIWRPLEISSNLVIFSGVPSHTYSDMNAWGPFATAKNWFNLYWMTFCGLLLLGGVLMWVRGQSNSFRQRLQIARQQINGRGALVALVLGLIWVGTGGFLFYNTKVVNEVTSSKQQERLSVDYEKTYIKYQGIPQPRITDVQYEIDMYPYERDFVAKAQLTVQNKSTEPIDSIHFSLPDEFKVDINIPGAEPVWMDSLLGYRIYALAEPLSPEAQLSFEVESSFISKGIENEVSVLSVVPNGTFVANYNFMPSIGYASQKELSDRDTRKGYNMPVKPRMPKLHENCGDACYNTYISNDADWVSVESIVSTAVDQIAVAPGSLIKEWEENGRRYFQYRLDRKSLNFYNFVSGKYTVERDTWQGPGGQQVDVEIYYHDGHEYNVDKMVKSVKNTLTYCTENFSPYPHQQARIIEFPRYASFAQAYPGTMPYSESIGFIADLTEEDAIDAVYYVVAHEMAHQWWAHQVIGANVQGATMMSETFAQYTALMVMEKEYGKDKMQQFMEYEMDRYLRGRGAERESEQPLLYNENQGYIHYRKGSVIMYALQDYIGEDQLNAALKAYVDSVAYQEPPYTTSLECYDYLQAATPDSLDYLLEDMFENITLYSNRATEANYRQLDDGRYEVQVEVEVQKFRADSTGRETPVAHNDWIDIGVLAEPEEGKQVARLLAVERRRINSPNATFTFIVDEKPFEAGIDPRNLLVDRFPDDNVKKVVELE